MFSNDINKSMIDSSVKVFPGSMIYGSSSSIGPNCIIGEEGPVVIENCQLGKNVQLKSGYFKDDSHLFRYDRMSLNRE